MASDYLLEIDGIKGESQDKKHKETIEVNSFSWGIMQPGSAAVGSGLASGKASFQDMHFTTHVSKASAPVAQHCAQGAHIKKATLYVRKAGGKSQDDFYVVTLEECFISSFQSGGGGGEITEQLSLNYTKVKFEYKEQAADGSLKGSTPMTWNVKTNALK